MHGLRYSMGMGKIRKNISIEISTEEILKEISRQILGGENISAIIDLLAQRVKNDPELQNQLRIKLEKK